MEDKNGAPIPESQKSAARAKAKGYWLKLFNNGIAPSSHGKADIDIKDSYIALMEDAFPWLHYCKNHWKCEQIWRNHYSYWYGNTLKLERKKAVAREKAAMEKAAAEGKIIDVDASDSNSQESQERSSKRPRVDEEMSETKHRRVDEVELTPPPRPAPTKVTAKRARVRLFTLPDYIPH